MQVQCMNEGVYKNVFDAYAKIARSEGLSVLVGRGLAASITREMTYTSVRIGFYDFVKSKVEPEGSDNSLFYKICSAGITGILGSGFVNPTDLIKVRQQAVLPGQTNPYKNFASAFLVILRTEGIRGLYVGVGPNVARAALVTASQLATYDYAKHYFLKQDIPEGILLHFLSAFIASISMVIFSSPADVIKSRYMNDKSSGSNIYKNGFHCLTETIRLHGIRGLYQGILPNYFRLAGHCMLFLPLYEEVRKLFGLTSV